MEFTTLKICGSDALRLLQGHRSRYPVSGQYPFLIGDAEELDRLSDGEVFIKSKPATIIRASLDVKPAEWMAARKAEAEENGFTTERMLDEWPGEIADKGSIGLHKDVVTGKIKPEVILGLAKIEKPWHLPAILRYGAWNDCPEPEVHCAFHREWHQRFGAEITGVSGDVIECTVSKPPRDRKAAMTLAWEHYWYCADIVEQGCESISNLAATLLNSPYWFFWWD